MGKNKIFGLPHFRLVERNLFCCTLFFLESIYLHFTRISCPCPIIIIFLFCLFWEMRWRLPPPQPQWSWCRARWVPWSWSQSAAGRPARRTGSHPSSGPWWRPSHRFYHLNVRVFFIRDYVLINGRGLVWEEMVNFQKRNRRFWIGFYTIYRGGRF